MSKYLLNFIHNCVRELFTRLKYIIEYIFNTLKIFESLKLRLHIFNKKFNYYVY